MKQQPFLLRLYRENQWFFLLCLLYLLIVAGLIIVLDKGEGIYFFSDHRSYFGDIFFTYGTQLGEEKGYFAILGIFLCYRYRYALVLPLIGLSVSIVSFSLKKIFAAPRPFAYFSDLDLMDQIQVVEGIVLNAGPTSFPSGHTMSGFTLLTYAALCSPWKRFTGPLFAVIAIIVGISRVYLVQHFLEDILAGALLGILLGILWYAIVQKYPPTPHRWIDGNLLQLFRKKIPLLTERSRSEQRKDG
ncbi:MAG: phosphatase PAP2 family protein [Bacteroidota bacterium]